MLKKSVDDWPPLKYENIWCEEEEGFFRIKNIPFFLENIAYGDLVKIKKVGKDTYTIDKVIEKSTHSTIWIYFCEDCIVKDVLNKIKKIGCGVEGGVVDNYYAVNAPDSNNLGKLYDVLEPLISNESVLVDYPSIKSA